MHFFWMSVSLFYETKQTLHSCFFVFRGNQLFAICLLVYWSMQRRSISFWGRHEYTSFSVAINGILVLVGTVSLFGVGCCTVLYE